MGSARLALVLLGACAAVGCGRIGFEAIDSSPGTDAAIDASHGMDATTDSGRADDAAVRPLVDSGRTDGAVVIPGDAATVEAGTVLDGGGSCLGGTTVPCPPSSVSVPAGMTVSRGGSTVGHPDQVTGSCGGAGVGEYVLQIDLTSFGFYSITATTDFDAVLYLLDGTCDGAERACVNATAGPGDETYRLGIAHGGSWIVVVDGIDGAACGNVTVRIDG